jgi:hypothetical protein
MRWCISAALGKSKNQSTRRNHRLPSLSNEVLFQPEIESAAAQTWQAMVLNHEHRPNKLRHSDNSSNLGYVRYAHQTDSESNVVSWSNSGLGNPYHGGVCHPIRLQAVERMPGSDHTPDIAIGNGTTVLSCIFCPAANARSPSHWEIGSELVPCSPRWWRWFVTWHVYYHRSLAKVGRFEDHGKRYWSYALELSRFQWNIQGTLFKLGIHVHQAHPNCTVRPDQECTQNRLLKSTKLPLHKATETLALKSREFCIGFISTETARV